MLLFIFTFNESMAKNFLILLEIYTIFNIVIFLRVQKYKFCFPYLFL